MHLSKYTFEFKGKKLLRPMKKYNLGVFLIASITFLQIAIFVILWHYYSTQPLFKCPCQTFGNAFSISKAAGILININISLIFLSITKTLRKFIYIPYKNKYIHVLFFCYLCIWSIIHIVGHYINVIKINKDILINGGVGLTGHFLILLIVLFIFFSYRKSISYSYENFMITHYILSLGFIIISCLHGTFCFIKYSLKTCPIPTTWIWILVPFLILLCEILYKYIFGKVEVINTNIYESSNILEIQLKLSEWYAGKTVWICCLDISGLEWHPFTVTFYKNGICFLHIKNRGDWTNDLFEICKNKNLKNILLDGPYFCTNPNLLKDDNQKVLCVSTGIGVTNFAYIMQKSLNNKKKKVYFVVIVKRYEEIKWLIDMLDNNCYFIWFFFTESNDNYYGINYILHRPDFNEIFEYIFIETLFVYEFPINVYYSGKRNPRKILKKICNKNKRFLLY